MAHGSNKAVIAALLANLGIAIAKFVGFVVTGAASMLAEGIHSVADTSNQGLLLFGGRRARREATPEHPFGYGRARYFYAFVVSIILFLLGGLFALYEGIEKLSHPHELTSAGWAVGILVLGIGLEGWSFRTAVVESNKLRRDESWWAFIRHAKIPELPVVLLEDLGALTGLTLALVGIDLAVLTGDPRWDALGSVAIGALLVVIAVILALEMKSLLLGEAASPRHRVALRAAMERHPRVERLIHMRTQHLGPEELLVAAKLELDASLTFDEVAAVIDEIERRMRDAVPIAEVIYLEPAVYRADAPGAQGPASSQAEAARKNPIPPP